jgi:hypothetical protein
MLSTLKPLMRIAMLVAGMSVPWTGMPPRLPNASLINKHNICIDKGMLAFKSKSLMRHKFLRVRIEDPQKKARKERMQRQFLHQLRKGTIPLLFHVSTAN